MTGALTIIASSDPPRVCKSYRLGDTGTLAKQAVAHVTEGTARTVPVDSAPALMILLSSITESDNQVICSGVFRDAGAEPFRLVSERRLAAMASTVEGEAPGGVQTINGERIAARLKRGIEPSAWLLLDADNPPGIPEAWRVLTLAERLMQLGTIIPGISTCERVELRGSSSRVVNGTGAPGPHTHGWIRVSDPARIEVLRHAALVAAVNAGLAFRSPRHSRSEPGRVIGHTWRSLIDFAVWDTGRLVFIAKPDVQASGYTAGDAGLRIVNAGGGALDLSGLDLPDDAALAAFAQRSGARLDVRREGDRVTVRSTGELTWETEIERRGTVQTLRHRVSTMKPGEKMRCETPFRASVSEAAVLRLGLNGRPVLHDVGSGITYHLADEAASSPEKRPLFRPLPDAPAFPAHALGPLREAAEAIHLRTQAPMALCAQSVLAAATLAAQPHRDVELPGGGRKPLTGTFASVADSGERKTTVDRIALAEVYAVEEEWRQAAKDELAHYKADLAGWKEAEASIRKKGKGDRALIRDGLVALGPEPKAPPHPMLLIADPTPEALVLHLADGRPWAGVFTAEGGLLVGGAAFNDESRMRTGALLNTLWDGEPIRRRRVITGASFLPGRRCSTHVMMQPVVAERLFGDTMLDGIGMLARVLLVAPESTVGTRLFRETPEECAGILGRYRARLGALLRRPPATKDDDNGVLAPEVMTLSPDARALWIAFSDYMEKEAGPSGTLSSIRAWAAKAAEHAGRLAAVLTLHADPDATEVPAEHMACGIELAQHYAQEMLRLAGAAGTNADLRLASRLLAWWQQRGTPHLHLAMIYQRGPNAISDAATARRLVEILVEHGHARKLSPGAAVDGAPRREAWELAP